MRIERNLQTQITLAFVGFLVLIAVAMEICVYEFDEKLLDVPEEHIAPFSGSTKSNKRLT
jgi:hypothetical protein